MTTYNAVCKNIKVFIWSVDDKSIYLKYILCY